MDYALPRARQDTFKRGDTTNTSIKTLAKLEVNPSIPADAFKVAIPAGYEKTEPYRHMVQDVLMLDQGFVECALDSEVKAALHDYLGPEFALVEAKGWLSNPTRVDFNGWHGDSSRMYKVGNVKRAAERLVDVTYEAMMRGIAVIRPGATTGDIGAAIQAYVEGQHMSVVRDFCGHGLGRLFHDEPNIVHVGRPGEGIVLRPGMFFTVEPMINLGRPHVKVLSDGWTAVTRDRSLSAQFEHTVAVTDTGVEIFTLSPRGLDRPPLSVGPRV
jgi:methionine aminopeptidase